MSNIVCTEYIYESEKVASVFDNYKIAVISDLHCKELGTNSCDILAKMNEINPDIVVAAGDIVSDHGRHFSVARNLLARLVERYPVYYACGNHELKLSVNPITRDKYRRYVRYMKNLGIHYLNNHSIKIVKDNVCIRISGLTIEQQYFSKIWNKKDMPDNYIDSLLRPCKHNRLEILIAHNPEYLNRYAQWGADIVFSGHIHGGLVILPGIGGVISPSLRLFPYYDYGEFHDGNAAMFLTRGLGAHTIPIRIWNPPEIMLVTLKSK